MREETTPEGQDSEPATQAERVYYRLRKGFIFTYGLNRHIAMIYRPIYATGWNHKRFFGHRWEELNVYLLIFKELAPSVEW